MRRNFPDQWGFTGNPLGIGFTDEGVGLFLDGYYGAPPNQTWGQQTALLRRQVPDLDGARCRQGALQGFSSRPTCTTAICSDLKEVVHFYNTRDAYPGAFCRRRLPPGNGGESELLATAGRSEQREYGPIGKLGLSGAEENDLVAFLENPDGWLRTNGEFEQHAGQHVEENLLRLQGARLH